MVDNLPEVLVILDVAVAQADEESAALYKGLF